MFPAIRFSYQNVNYSPAREIICTKLTEAVSTVIPLPNEIVILIANLGNSTYGSTGVDFRSKNKVNINNILSLEEIPKVLVHELIHLNQLYTGELKASRTGTYFWKNRPYKINVSTMDYDTHQQLPWEVDVLNRQEKVLSMALNYAMKR